MSRLRILETKWEKCSSEGPKELRNIHKEMNPIGRKT